MYRSSKMGTRVYVGKLHYDVRERDLERFFKGYGRVREILMKEGFAFIEFEDHHDADDAVYDLNGKELMGERVHVEFAREQRGPRGRGGDRFSSRYNSRYDSRKSNYRSGGLHYAEKYGPPRNTEYRVIVENLSSRVSWQDLKDFMRSVGEVTYADAHKRERNMGIVDFATYTDMKNAIEKLDGQELHGRRIRLIEDKSRRGRSRNSRSRSRSRTRRSRSRSRRSSRSRSRSRKSRSRSHSRSRSKSRSRSVEKNGNGDEKSRSRSKTRSRSRSGSRTKSTDDKQSRSRSPTRSRSRSRSIIRNKSLSRSISRSPDRSKQSRSRSHSHQSRSRSRSRSDRRSRSKTRSRSRSRSISRSPINKDVEMNGTD